MHDTFPFDESLPGRRSAAADTDLVEFTDDKDRLLLVAPLAEAARLGLRHKVVGVALAVSGGRLYLRRRSGPASFPRCLDLSGVAHVRPGESRKDAAWRALGQAFAAERIPLVQKADFVLSFADVRQHVTLFLAGPDRMARPLPPSDPHCSEEGAESGFFLDRDELEGLVLSAPELLTPALLWSVRSGLLWPA